MDVVRCKISEHLVGSWHSTWNIIWSTRLSKFRSVGFPFFSELYHTLEKPSTRRRKSEMFRFSSLKRMSFEELPAELFFKSVKGISLSPIKSGVDGNGNMNVTQSLLLLLNFSCSAQWWDQNSSDEKDTFHHRCPPLIVTVLSSVKNRHSFLFQFIPVFLVNSGGSTKVSSKQRTKATINASDVLSAFFLVAHDQDASMADLPSLCTNVSKIPVFVCLRLYLFRLSGTTHRWRKESSQVARSSQSHLSRSSK